MAIGKNDLSYCLSLSFSFHCLKSLSLSLLLASLMHLFLPAVLLIFILLFSRFALLSFYSIFICSSIHNLCGFQCVIQVVLLYAVAKRILIMPHPFFDILSFALISFNCIDDLFIFYHFIFNSLR